MGFSTDDMRIRNSFEIAKEKGLTFSFTPNELETDIHPNTVDIHMVNNNGQEMTVRGESLGGGKVRIVKINSVQVDFSGSFSTSVIFSIRDILTINLLASETFRNVGIQFAAHTERAAGCQVCRA
jgi:iron-sulfur-dependent L-serine dehydratase beta subunit